ncbi:MAG: J domain-containing protein [Caldilineaceae bacterium]
MPSAEPFAKAMKADAPDPYLVLGIGRRATDAEIKRAYFQLVRQFPPEREPEKFQQIRAAYERLRTPESRALIDLFLLQPPPDLPNRRRPSYDLSVHQEDLAILALELAATPVEKDFQP